MNSNTNHFITYDIELSLGDVIADLKSKGYGFKIVPIEQANYFEPKFTKIEWERVEPPVNTTPLQEGQLVAPVYGE